MEGQSERSPLRPTLERGPHQGSELRLLGLHIRSLTAASAFRHLVRRPGPAGPDIRLAHGVLWAAPTQARKHARARARCRCQLPPPLSAPTSCPRQLERTEEGWTPRGGGHVPPRLRGFFGKNARSPAPSSTSQALAPSWPAGLPCCSIRVQKPAPRFLFCFVLFPLGAVALPARPPKARSS